MALPSYHDGSSSFEYKGVIKDIGAWPLLVVFPEHDWIRVCIGTSCWETSWSALKSFHPHKGETRSITETKTASGEINALLQIMAVQHRRIRGLTDENRILRIHLREKEGRIENLELNRGRGKKNAILRRIKAQLDELLARAQTNRKEAHRTYAEFRRQAQQIHACVQLVTAPPPKPRRSSRADRRLKGEILGLCESIEKKRTSNDA